MTSHRIEFASMEWESVAKGVRQREFTDGGQRIRIIEFSDSFIEADWCTAGHVGYVISGRIDINFDGDVVSYAAGDGLIIRKGTADRHKAIIPAGESATLVLFDDSHSHP